MRAAAVALVLIVGAAVVLWYGNTLNSWVLGGLIGGLAAILLSIPISLTLFSYLSRRHEEQLQAAEQAEQEESLLLQEEEDYDYLQAPAEIYEADPYLLPQTIERGQRSTGRNLPAPSVQALPPARQSQQFIPVENLQQQRANDYPYSTEPVRQQRPASAPSSERANQSPTRRPTPVKPPVKSPARSARYPGFPGYQTNAQRGYHQTMALRAARLEATQQHADASASPTSTSKRLPAVRPNQAVAKVPRTSRQLQSQPSPQARQQTASHYRPKPTVEGSSLPPGASRALPRPGESSINRPSGTIPKYGQEPQEPHTDQIGTHYPQTGQVRRSPQTGQTQATRNPRVEAQPRNPDVITGSLKNPMVRRAPYMYDDDPLRQELAQQIDPNNVRRRSSRSQDYDYEDE